MHELIILLRSVLYSNTAFSQVYLLIVTYLFVTFKRCVNFLQKNLNTCCTILTLLESHCGCCWRLLAVMFVGVALWTQKEKLRASITCPLYNLRTLFFSLQSFPLIQVLLISFGFVFFCSCCCAGLKANSWSVPPRH